MQNQVPQNTPRPCFDKNATLQARDEDRLHYALTQMCGVPENSPQAPRAYDQHDIVVALAYAGVTTFWGAFLTLTEDDIMLLELPPDPANPHLGPVKLPLFNRRLLVCLGSYYHDLAREYVKRINVNRLSVQGFNDHRISKVRSKNPIVPCGIPLPHSPTQMEMATWEKLI